MDAARQADLHSERSPSNLAILILAGGEGSRIGGDKPLRCLGDESLIARAWRRAGSWSRHVAVAVRDNAQLGGHPYPAILDAEGIDGPLAGLAAGLRWAMAHDRPALLTIPCDMPFLPDDLPHRLSDEIGPLAAALTMSGGHVHPVCALWRVVALDAMADYLAGGRRSLRGLAEVAGCVTVEWRATALDPFFNINTTADLARAEALQAR